MYRCSGISCDGTPRRGSPSYTATASLLVDALCILATALLLAAATIGAPAIQHSTPLGLAMEYAHQFASQCAKNTSWRPNPHVDIRLIYPLPYYFPLLFVHILICPNLLLTKEANCCVIFTSTL